MSLDHQHREPNLEAHHLCVAMRGVRDAAPLTRTTVWRGYFAQNPALRAEFLRSIR